MLSFAQDHSEGIGNTIYETSPDSVFTTKQMVSIRRYSQSNKKDIYWIKHILYVDSNGERRLAKEPFIIYR